MKKKERNSGKYNEKAKGSIRNLIKWKNKIKYKECNEKLLNDSKQMKKVKMVRLCIHHYFYIG